MIILHYKRSIISAKPRKSYVPSEIQQTMYLSPSKTRGHESTFPCMKQTGRTLQKQHDHVPLHETDRKNTAKNNMTIESVHYLTPRYRLLTQLCITAKKLELTRESYRKLMLRVLGKESEENCSDAQLQLALAELVRLQRSPKHIRPLVQSKDSPPYSCARESLQQMHALWKSLGKSQKIHTTLRAFVKHLIGLDDPTWLSRAQVHVVLEQLKRQKNLPQ